MAITTKNLGKLGGKQDYWFFKPLNYRRYALPKGDYVICTIRNQSGAKVFTNKSENYVEASSWFFRFTGITYVSFYDVMQALIIPHSWDGPYSDPPPTSV